MKHIKKTIHICLFGIFLISSAKVYPANKEHFAYLNKSYHKDVNNSLNMYKSFLKHYKGKSKFFISMPSKDKKLFQDTFSKLNLKPNFITDEEVFHKCGEDVNAVMNMPGWKGQQIIKLCFGVLANQYITFDSDLQIIKDFDDSIFYDKSTKLLKTFVNFHRHDKTAKEIHLIYTSNGNAKTKDLPYFVSAYGIWDSKLLQNMLKYLKEKHSINNFYEVILTSPWEMQWYGEYILNIEKDKFIPMETVEGLVHHGKKFANDNFTICRHIAKLKNSKGYKDLYFLVLQGTIKAKEWSVEEYWNNNCKEIYNTVYKLRCKLFNCIVDNLCPNDLGWSRF